MESARRQQHACASRAATCASPSQPLYRLRTLGELRVDGPSGEVKGLRRKERLLCVYLARATGPVRRAELLALLWGEQPEAKARHALRQALCALRRWLPEAVCAGPELVCLVAGAVELDVAGVERDVRDGRPAEAVARWGGEFLPGLEDAGDEPLRSWIEAERAAVRRLLSGALDALVTTTRDPEDSLLATVRRWAELHPWDEAAQCRLVRLLRSAGRLDEAAALHARAMERLREELGAEPSVEFRALGEVAAGRAPSPDVPAELWAGWLRARAGGAAVVRLPCVTGAVALDALVLRLHESGDAPVVLRADAGEPVSAEPLAAARRLLCAARHARGVAAVPDALLAEVARLVPALRERYPQLPVASGCTSALRAGVAALLTEVAAESPIVVALERAPSADAASRALVDEVAAHLPAGVLLVLTGTDSAADDGAARDPTRAADERDGVSVIDVGYTTSASSGIGHAPHRPQRTRRLLRVVAAAAAILVVTAVQFARAEWVDRGHAQEADVAARLYYAAGMQLLQVEHDDVGALRLLSRALERDSSFALAAFYAGRAAGHVSGHDAASGLLHLAAALSASAPEDERLFIAAATALEFNDPHAYELVAALVRRYPERPSSTLLRARALVQDGRFLDAVHPLRRVITADTSAHDPVMQGRCAACEARELLAVAWWMADSTDAALRALHGWAAAQPGDPVPLQAMAAHFAAVGRHAEARAARSRAAAVGGRTGTDVFADVIADLSRGDFAAADPALDYLGRSGGADVARRALWLQVISFRDQQRHADAWRAATAYRDATIPGRAALHPHATPQAIVLMESGQPARAAAMFDTMFHQLGNLGHPARTARDQAWLLTLRASALAAAGDTARLAALADTVQALGARSGYGRDRKLHHHVRGLLHAARGELAAAEYEFRAAIYSPTAGYTRTNVELARVLLRAGRHADAIAPLQSAMRAPLDGPALYVTKTELIRLLAEAYGRGGSIDRAADPHRLARSHGQ